MTNVKEVDERIVVGDGKEVNWKECQDVCMRNKATTNEALLLKNVPDIHNFHKNIIVSIGTFVRDAKCKLGMKKTKMTLRKTGQAATLSFKRNHSDIF